MLTPVIDSRDRTGIENKVRERIPGYTPGWQPDSGTSSGALLEAYAGHLAVFVNGLNQVPDRSRMAFLDLMGTGLLRARAARAPLVFTLMENSLDNSNVAANTRIAAPAAPPPVSALLKPGQEAENSLAEVIFATTQSISITRANLATVYSLDPANDLVAEHINCLTTGFTLFDSLQSVPHEIYLGHDKDFIISGIATIRLSVRFASYPPLTVRQGLQVSWSYWAEAGWIPMELVEDGTNGFTTSGEIVIKSDCGPDSASKVIGEHETYWIRGVLETSLVPDGAGDYGRLPAIDLIEERIELSKIDLQADVAFNDVTQLDISKRFYPFGPRPELHGTFYLSCKEAFTRNSAEILLQLDLFKDIDEPNEDLVLAWHYFNGNEWSDLTSFNFEDTTDNLIKSGEVRFTSPNDWAESEVNGSKGYWLRAQINAGDYGEPLRLDVDANDVVTLKQESYDPPNIETLRITYNYITNPNLVGHCLTCNNAVFEEHTEDARWQRRLFEPFVPLDELQPAVHIGFDEMLPAGLISLYLHTSHAGFMGNESTHPSPFTWEYQNDMGWSELSVRDETEGFRSSGMLQFVGPSDAIATAGRGGELYRIRARLKRGESMDTLAVDGLWLNAVWATHRERVDGDILGSSDGNPGQSFNLLRAVGSVLEDEIVEVREWNGNGMDWETVAESANDENVRLEKDTVSDTVTAVWIRWQRVDHLYNSRPDDRHYVIEPAQNLIRFGDGRYGKIPPAQSQIIASYNSGGGVVANVAADSITELHGSVAYLESVTNPVAAEGGADLEASERVDARGPQRLRHRDRAVTAEDFEWLAREASPDVYHARCLPLVGEAGFAQRGWVTLIIAPQSSANQPQPTAELRRQVLSHVTSRTPAAIAAQVRVGGPEYVSVSVVCEVVPKQADSAAVVEAQLRANLQAFLHPVTGGPEGKGWQFGEAVYLSQIAKVVENDTEGVDYAVQLRITVGDTMFDDGIPVDENKLIASGAHEIKITLGDV